MVVEEVDFGDVYYYYYYYYYSDHRIFDVWQVVNVEEGHDEYDGVVIAEAADVGVVDVAEMESEAEKSAEVV